jgi:hypothetical protein
MSRRTQKQLVELRLTNIRNNNVRKSFKWGFSDKTGWDCLDLFAKLAIPIVVVVATILFGWWQGQLADLQHQSDQKLAQQQHDSDQQSTLDQQRTAILQTYIDNIQDLLLNHNLLGSKPNDDVAILARARTLTALQGLDPERKGRLLMFLHEDELIGFDDNNGKKHESIINLSGANLNRVYLFGANLRGADLSNADLSGANLRGADLSDTNLFNDYLTGAVLFGAILFGAELFEARLVGADLTGTNLSDADLGDANLTDAQNLTQPQVDQVHSCENATLPPGLTCHRFQGV